MTAGVSHAIRPMAWFGPDRSISPDWNELAQGCADGSTALAE